MNDEEPQTIPRLPEIAKVRMEDRWNPFPRTAVVQVVDYYLKEKDDGNDEQTDV